MDWKKTNKIIDEFIVENHDKLMEFADSDFCKQLAEVHKKTYKDFVKEFNDTEKIIFTWTEGK